MQVSTKYIMVILAHSALKKINKKNNYKQHLFRTSFTILRIASFLLSFDIEKVDKNV